MSAAEFGIDLEAFRRELDSLQSRTRRRDWTRRDMPPGDDGLAIGLPDFTDERDTLGAEPEDRTVTGGRPAGYDRLWGSGL